MTSFSRLFTSMLHIARSVFNALFLTFLLVAVIAVPRLPAQENGFVQDLDLVTMPTGEKLVRWYGKTGHSYFLQASKASGPLVKWGWAPMIESGNDQYISHEVDGTPDKGFFRLLHTTLEQPLGVSLEVWDPDGDRLNNWTEITTHGSNPLKPDTDDDGLPDGWEVAHNLNVLDNGTEDPDRGPAAPFGPQSLMAAATVATTNAQAFAAGVQAVTGATMADRDGDLVPDAEDADPLSPAVNWRKSSKPVYAAIPVPGWVSATHSFPVRLNNQNDVLTNRAVYKGGQWIPINAYYSPFGQGPALPYQFAINGRLHPCHLGQCQSFSVSDQGEIMASGKILIDPVTEIDPATGQEVTYSVGYKPDFAMIWRTPAALPEIFGVAPGTTFQGAYHAQAGIRHRDGTVLMAKRRPQDILGNNDGTLERWPNAADGGGVQTSPVFYSPSYTYPAIGGSFTFRSYLSTAQGLVLQSWVWPATGTPKSLYTVATSASGAPALNFQSSPSTIGTAPGGEACINLSGQVLVGHSGRYHQVASLQGATNISPHGAAIIPTPPGNPTVWYGGSSYSLSSCVSNPQALGSTLTVRDLNDNGSMLAIVDVNTAGQKLVILLPVEVVELAPKLRDSNNNEIAGSEVPKPLPGSNSMVEEAPVTNKIAHRELKVKIGSALKDKKITWTMDARFTPEGEAQPRFGGDWADAATSHRDRFETSTTFGAHAYRRISQEQAETTVDADGFTAIRANLPPIGFNKARVRIQIEGLTTEIELIDLDVQAVVVIDPGHGGTPETDFTSASWNNSTSPSGVLEKTMALSYGLELKTSLETHVQAQHLNLKVLMTRTTDTSISGQDRADLAKQSGGDSIFIIHFNASAAHTARGTLEVRRTAGNVNPQEDIDFIDAALTRMVTAMQGFDAASNRRAAVVNDTSVASDTNLGNTAEYFPIRAGYCEVEFIDFGAHTADQADDTVDILLNTGPNAGPIRTAIANAIRDGILHNLRTLPRTSP